MQIRITQLDSKRYQARVPWRNESGYSTVIHTFTASELAQLEQLCAEQGVNITFT